MAGLAPGARKHIITRRAVEKEVDHAGLCKRYHGKQVRSIMSRGAVTASPDDHVMAIIDRMVKNKYRRLPVVENGRLMGIVYVADVFFHLFKK